MRARSTRVRGYRMRSCRMVGSTRKTACPSSRSGLALFFHRALLTSRRGCTGGPMVGCSTRPRQSRSAGSLFQATICAGDFPADRATKRRREVVHHPCCRKRSVARNARAVPITARLLGSGTAGPVAGTTVVCAEELVTVVDPSRFTSTVNANPLTVSLVRTGIVPAASENMLKANVLPEVDVPLGELNAGPKRLT